MKIIKVQLEKEEGINDILSFLEVVEADKIVWVCPRNFALFSEVAIVKRLKAKAEEGNKKMVFVISQKFVRTILKRHDFECFSTVPNTFKEFETITIESVLNPPVEVIGEDAEEEEVKEEKPTFPDFHLKRITKTPVVSRAKIFFAVLVLIGLLILGGWWFSPKVYITVKPKIQAVPFIQNIVVEFPEAEILDEDSELPHIKGIFVRTTVKDEEIITSGGRRYDVTNARGKVTLYNETAEEKYLVPSRLEAAGGIIVRFKKPVTIPPRTDNGPGSVVVAVEADSFDENERPIGNRGNIDAGTELRFPALRDELQELYYARANKGPLVGGSTLTHYIIIEEDEEKAKDILLDDFRYRGIQALKEEVEQRSQREGGNQFLLEHPTLLRAELKEYVFPTDMIGAEEQTFTVSGEVEVSGIVFDQAAVKDMLQQRIAQTLDERQKLVHIDEKSIEYELLSSESFEDDKWVKISVKVVGVEQLDLDSENPKAQAWKEELRHEIMGKGKGNARSILINNPEIEEVLDMKLDPLWSSKLPTDPEKIYFRVKDVEVK